METILVAGGAGFIGSHFVKMLLADNLNVKVINLDKLTYAGNRDNLKEVSENKNHIFVKGDIINSELVEHLIKTHEITQIVNFAAESHVDRSIDSPDIFLTTNFLAVNTLLKLARQHGIAYLHISSDEIYGDVTEGSRQESAAACPSSPYSAAKAAAELLVLSFARTYGLNVKITRSSNNYGPNQYPEKLIPLAITNIIEGKKVPVYGDGMQMRDWLYVKDNCDAIKFVMERGGNGEIYNICSGIKKTNMEVINLILAALGKDKSCLEFVTDRPGHDRRYSPDPAKLSGLGWKHKTNFESGIKETVGWYLQNEWWWKKLKGSMKEIGWLHGNK